jgi:glycosyltransferase involved in cell wall biosynthesis
MRVTFLLRNADNLAGGNRVIAQHAAHLVATGHDVTLLSRPRAARRKGLRGRLAALLGRPPTVHGRGQPGGHFTPLGLTVTQLPPGDNLPANLVPNADVVVAGWWETAEWMGRLPASKGAQVHFVQDYEVFPHLPQDRATAVHALPCRRIVVAGWLQRLLKDRHGIDAEIALNGVDAAVFRAPDRTPDHTAPRDGTFTVGFLFSAAPRKNISLAVEALDRARTHLPGLRARAFGAHDPAGALPGWIDFEFRPTQARIPQIYAACDAWLFPSRSEGFGLPILEAMACGTPVLATDAGAAPDLIDGCNGVLLPHDPDAFAAAIADMAARAVADRTAMSRAARTTAEAHDIARASARFTALLESMCKPVSQSLEASDPESGDARP